MKRPWLWIFGGMGAVAVAAVFALALLTPRSPFKFLDGRSPLIVRFRPTNTLDWDASRDLAFTFPANPDEILRQAKAELEVLGFDNHYSSNADLSQGFQRIANGEEEYVLVIQKARIRSVTSEGFMRVLRTRGQDPGWVTVLIRGAPRIGVWDRVRALFGL